MSALDLVSFKSGGIHRFVMGEEPVMTNVTFRIPLKFEDPREYRGAYDAVAIPLTLPDGEDGYAIYVAKQDEGGVSNVIWSETIRMKGVGFVLSDDKYYKENFPEGSHSDFSSYYHTCASQFMLLLNIAVFRVAPDKISINLTGPFSETY